jgi:bacillaene synthase trans-acting acyltransferase
MTKVVFMFSGQGAQYYQMGKELYDENEVFRATMDAGDRFCRRKIGRSIVSELYSNPITTPFTDFSINHPALFLVQYALFQTLSDIEVRANCLWGCSAGEIVAAAAAGIIDFETGLEIMIEQTIQVVGKCEEGGMLAVLAPLEECREEVSSLEIAAINAMNNFVVAGKPQALAEAARSLKARGLSSLRLPVPYAFHSTLIDTAELPFKEFCRTNVKLRAANARIISSAKCGYMDEMCPDHFWDVVRKPILFFDTLRKLSKEPNLLFVDCSPSATLATFMKYSGASFSTFPILSPFRQGRAGQDILNLRAAIAQMRVA